MSRYLIGHSLGKYHYNIGICKASVWHCQPDYADYVCNIASDKKHMNFSIPLVRVYTCREMPELQGNTEHILKY